MQGQSEYPCSVEEGDEYINVEINLFANQVTFKNKVKGDSDKFVNKY